MPPTEETVEQESAEKSQWASEMWAMIDRRIDERVQAEVKRQLDERMRDLMRNIGYMQKIWQKI